VEDLMGEEIKGDFAIECKKEGEFFSCEIYQIDTNEPFRKIKTKSLYFENAGFVSVNEKIKSRIVNAKCDIKPEKLDCWKRYSYD
jgi:hypothetical protein